MNIYNQNRLNSLSSYTASLFKDTLIPNITAQQKKIYAIAIFAIGFLVVCIISLKTRSWSLDKKLSNKNETPISKTETPQTKDNIPNVNEIVKAKQDAELIKAQATAKALAIIAEAEAEA